MINTAIGSLRRHALVCFKIGVEAAEPYLAVKRHMLTDGNRFGLILADGSQRYGTWPKVHVIAFGKAACAMVKAAREVIPVHLLACCIAVTNDDNVIALDGIELLAASHPLPDERGFKAAQICAEIAEAAQKDELVLVLISGGGSALLPYPVKTVSLQDKIAATDLLLASGASINQMNCVRKHLSQLKGGGLAKLAYPADVHALILSDVLGDDISAIASGPTVPDETTYADALSILESKNLADKIPANVKRHLEHGRDGQIAETPKSGDEVFAHASHTLIGSNALSVHAVMQATQANGYFMLLYSDHLRGEARDEAEKLVLFAKKTICSMGEPLAIIAGGETTVTLKGNGKGGRNQEMALAFAISAQHHNLPGNWVFLSGGTDGRDGPTEAAGGMVDSGTIQRMIAAGINPGELLDNNDSYVTLKTSHDLLMTGATGTNVADLQILLILP
ncbi:glycerate kinase type-2 family protein [Crenothrix polyspora]|uniref:Glycerate 2-kinase Gck n=1 Tax=Crenothrix polyspora TaxID=360316 RepID=A0A1R4H8Q8_9GAMM|nr:glycerate kinase [Crenothrix polyspora]SJM92547.1 Glycerate 2-kinase Gck [Crenothrix polyspora]